MSISVPVSRRFDDVFTLNTKSFNHEGGLLTLAEVLRGTSATICESRESTLLFFMISEGDS